MKPRKKFWSGPLCFALIWAIIFAVPRLRILAVYQFASDEDVGKVGIWLAPVIYPIARFWPQRSESIAAENFAARNPNDARVQAWLNRSSGLENAQKLEPLLEQFSYEAWLHAEYLISLCSGFQSGRVAGILMAPAPGVPPPAEKPANLSPMQIRRAIEVCQRGAQLEPQNSFWDWMQALFLFGARRDEEAIGVLQSGAAKKFFDDHLTEITRKKLEADELFRPRPIETKFVDWIWALSTHLGRIREVARLATWNALQKQARGDQKGALSIRRDVGRLGTQMRDQDGLYITTLVGFAVQSIAWRGDLKRRGVPAGNSNQSSFWSVPFARQCRAVGYDDWAQEVLREGAYNAQFHKKMRAYVKTPTVLPGAPDSLWTRLLGLNWMGASLLIQLLLTLPAWLFVSVLLWWKRVPGETRGQGAAWGVWLLVVAFCLLVGGAAMYYGGGWGNWIGWQLNATNTLPTSEILIATLRWSIAFGPLLLGALLCGLIGAWQQRQQWRAFDETHDKTQNNFLLRPTWRRGVWLLIFALILIACAAACWQEVAGPPRLKTPYFFSDPVAWTGHFLTSPLFAFNLLFFAVFWWIFSSVWLIPDAARPLAGQNLKWYRQSLGVALVGGSALYLLLLLISLEVRRPAEVAFNNLMLRGEMAVLRSVIKES